MKKILCFCFVCFVLLNASCSVTASKVNSENIPLKYTGTFEDDYGIKYKISRDSFLQMPGAVYRIIVWDIKEQYIIAQNSPRNVSDQLLFTRIDYVDFANMAPYRWGFCYTVYKASSAKEAINTAAADRSNPKKGCNGYPFSRLKRIK